MCVKTREAENHMKKQIKQLIAAGCLFAILFLTACGAASQDENRPAVPDMPGETAAQVQTESSAPTENTSEQIPETVPEETEPTGLPGEAEPESQSAAGSFTGVAGTEFIIPEGFVRLDETPSIGYQYTFWHPDYEIRIVVYEITPGSIPEGAYETDLSIAQRNPDVTYFNKGENWFVQSGYNNNGEEIFYSKESITDRGLKTFWISYPTAKREFGDPITAEFEKNFRF